MICLQIIVARVLATLRWERSRTVETLEFLVRSPLAAAFHGAGRLTRGIYAWGVSAELFARGFRGVVAVREAVL